MRFLWLLKGVGDCFDLGGSVVVDCKRRFW